MKPAVELKQITHAYVSDREASLAIEDINLTVYPGEFVSLIGPSGCGKTTLLSIIAGLLQPSKGTVTVNGHAVEGTSPEVGYMLQQDYLFPWLSIQKNALLGLELTGGLNEASAVLIEELLKEMDLAGYGSFYPQQLSGGMRQRVALVRTLAADPSLLLLDEPFSALDYQTKLKLENLIVKTLKERRKTAVLVTHDLSEAIAMSDRVVLLNRNPGRIHYVFDVTEPVRSTEPFLARKEPGFNELFHSIWHEMEKISGKE
ncbi:ABC transporter related protein [Paenibacillus algicola]|uniref:ABC transporter related protein n=1 Tax=Paenibacillus algicola TaxID=2565926 RepID=A0A4P8XQF9_9BACL|nr:ABC transporter ATP-binding protein [Paenibacillus algicola]QCT02679.1 ABC transporter related protein [Paenibacillus algicola]